ncbi:MAG: SsrA-binding protein SmpB [Spirochaetales bacterium]|nr:SsrA-binding protein SmpB [Spirochaetales bacterium]
MAEERQGTKTLAVNRRARYDYTVEENLECGIALEGTEVKSLKAGKFSFSDSYAKIDNDQLVLVGFHITPYMFGNIHNHEPDRLRVLLAHKKEIKRLKRKVDERGYTLIPLRVYLKRGLIKLDLGICQGKKQKDKREAIKERDVKREVEREFRGRL